MRPAALWLVGAAITAGCGHPAPSAAPAPAAADARHAPLAHRLQLALDSARAANRYPGISLGLVLPDGSVLGITSGFEDTARRAPLTPRHKLLQGSVGKTYVAAVAFQLVSQGLLDLDAPISRYLGDQPWFDRLPNSRAITVKQLMNHTSGLVRYEFDPRATAVLRAQPMKRWTGEERLSYLFDTKAAFLPGQGWDYSDTNYIVLGMIIERLTGESYDRNLRRRLLEPLGLRHTVPADNPAVPGIANGYAGPHNELGGYDGSLDGAGRLRVNPQFEWTGGGVASTTSDLARWGMLLYQGKAFDPALLPRMLDFVPSRLGPNVRYGLGVIGRETPLGPAWGHSGFFPGYATELLYFPDHRIAAAVQVNQTDPYPRTLVPLLIELVRAALAAN
jgi:D-alanyl-D-alanine carboxypeptidase